MTSIKSVDPKTAWEWLSSGKAIIVDVREPAEYAVMHIEGAHLIPLGTIGIDTLPELQSKKLIIHCQLGRRGGVACEKLMKFSPDLDVYNLEGGITAWKQAGYQVKIG